MEKKFILVNGFGWSGSSALIDFFREFNCTYVPKKEFRLLKDPHGLIDLDRSITDSIDALNEDIALREFIKFSNSYIKKGNGFKKMGLGYSIEFGKNIKEITTKYINDLIDYNYSSYWWYLDINNSLLKTVWFKSLKKLHIYKHSNHTKMMLSLKTENDFLNLTHNYLSSIFDEFINEKCNTIVLDQAVPANRPEYGNRFFPGCKVILVDRDPRDVYIDLINEKSLVGYDIEKNHDVSLFIKWFKKVRKTFSTNSNYLKINFEDFVLDYDATTKKILNYCEIDEKEHSDKLTFFNPNISCKNIGLWKNYQYQEEIRAIEKELNEYLHQTDINEVKR